MEAESRTLYINDLLSRIENANRTRSGITVTPQSAMTSSPVWQAVDVISSDIAKLPLHCYEQKADGTRKKAETQPVYKLLNGKIGPDPWDLTSNLWKSLQISWALLYGNAYSFIRLGDNGKPDKLIPLHPRQVAPVHENGVLYYLVKFDEGAATPLRVPASEMLHIRGLMLEQKEGLSLVGYAAHTIGRMQGAESYADDFNSNAITPSGYFEHPGEMGDAALVNFRREVDRQHTGTGNRHRSLILEEGMKYNPTVINPKDATLVEQLKLSKNDVAGYFNLPPHKLGDNSQSNYNTLEEENAAYHNSTLGKWIDRLEQETTEKLFVNENRRRRRFYAEFLQDAMSKASTKDKYDVYSVALQMGIMSPNEVRAKENMPPYEGGDVYLVPLNLGQPGEAEEEPAEVVDSAGDTEDDGDRSATLRVSIKDKLTEEILACVQLLANRAKKAAKEPNKFLTEINEIETKYTPKIQERMLSMARIIGELRGDEGPTELELSTQIAMDLTGRFYDLMLVASAVQPDGLQGSVSDQLAGLNKWANQYSTEIVF